MNSFPEVVVGKPVKDWTRLERWGVTLLSGIMAFALSLLPWLFREFLQPWRRAFWPGIFAVGTVFGLVVMVLVSRRRPPPIRREESGTI